MIDKITNRFNIQLTAAFIFLTAYIPVLQAQENANIRVMKKYAVYKRSLTNDSLKKMVELKTIVPGLRYDLRYATINNFMKEQLYKNGDATFLRLPAAEALSKVQHELNEKGLSLKVWDAYRPYSVTVRMWELIKDDRYVADPKKGSGHNRGIAIDLTIINNTTGAELNMGTDFDNFSDTAQPGFTHLPEEVLQNRLLLKNLMEKYGFKVLETEWWHFYWSKAADFELMDIDFKKFKKRE